MTGGGCASAGSKGKPTTLRSAIIAEEVVMAKKLLDPIPPGEILLEEFMQSDYDLRMIRRTAGDAIEAQVRVLAA
jgi:plasmid maintenance system antidote protein VapI